MKRSKKSVFFTISCVPCFNCSLDTEMSFCPTEQVKVLFSEGILMLQIGHRICEKFRKHKKELKRPFRN